MFRKHKDTIRKGTGKTPCAARGRRLFGFKGMTALVGAFLLLSAGLYIGERKVRATPQWRPVNARIRLVTKTGKSRPFPDPDVGFLEPPHLRMWVTSEDFEFLQETDAYGFFNHEPWPDTVDIVFLGDSLLGGNGVDIEHQFSTLVDQAFPDNTILNLGVAGAAPNRQLQLYRKFAAPFRPRLVISGIYLAADLENEPHFDTWVKNGKKGDYNQFRLALGDQRHPKSFWTRVQRRCYLCGKVTELVLRWNGVPDAFIFPTGQAVFLDIDKLRFLSHELSPSDQRVMLILSSLRGIQALAQSQGARFAVVLIPSKEEIYGAPFMPEVMKPVEVLQQRLQEEGFPVLSLYDVVRDRGQDQPAFFPSDIHLNAYGNRIVAERLVDWLRENQFLETPPNHRASAFEHGEDLPLR